MAVSRLLLFVYDIVRCGISIGPATLCWGASFPLALAAANVGESDVGWLVARVLVVNTVGVLVGIVFFSLVVVFGLGTQRAQQVLVALATAVVVLMLVMRRGVAVGVGYVLALSCGLGLRPVLLGGLVAVVIVASLWVVLAILNGLIAFGCDIVLWDTIDRYLYIREGVSVSVVVSDSVFGFR